MKKAQSQIITTVLIILLVLAAIIIVWQVINRTVSQSSSDVEDKAACFDIQLKITKAIAGNKKVAVELISDTNELSKIRVLVNGKEVNKTADASDLTTLGSMDISFENPLKSGDEIIVAPITKTGYKCHEADKKTVS